MNTFELGLIERQHNTTQLYLYHSKLIAELKELLRLRPSIGKFAALVISGTVKIHTNLIS